MHRDIIARVNAKLSEIGEKSYPKVEGWPKPPDATDKDWPVPPTYSLGAPGTDAYIKECKSQAFYSGQMAEWVRHLFKPRQSSVLESLRIGQRPRRRLDAGKRTTGPGPLGGTWVGPMPRDAPAMSMFAHMPTHDTAGGRIITTIWTACLSWRVFCARLA
ncbi:MAG: hypothetical protein ACJ746_12235 [Bryobacteraceae bacterium]